MLLSATAARTSGRILQLKQRPCLRNCMFMSRVLGRIQQLPDPVTKPSAAESISLSKIAQPTNPLTPTLSKFGRGEGAGVASDCARNPEVFPCHPWAVI